MLTLEQCHELCLYPCLRVRTPKALGSGTVVFVEPSPGEEGMFDAYVMTNHHVVENLIEVKDKWSTVLQRNVKADILGHPDVEVFHFAYKSRVQGSASFQSDIMAYDQYHDLALLRVRSPEKFAHVAKLYPQEKMNKLVAFMEAWNVGCGLGGSPAITSGYLSAFGVDIDHKDFMLVTAPSIFGNSGGATFLKETGEYIGIPARISVASMGWSADAITHLGYSIPISRICEFLKDQSYDFIFDPCKTSVECDKEREAKREADLKRRIGDNV